MIPEIGFIIAAYVVVRLLELSFSRILHPLVRVASMLVIPLILLLTWDLHYTATHLPQAMR